MVIQSNCFAAWNYGRDVGETVNLDVQRTFYLHFLVNCMGMYCQLLFFPPTGDLVLHFINSLERPQSFQKELLRLFKFSCRKKAAVLVQPEPECSPPFCKVPIFGRGPIATMWWSLASRHEKGLVTSRNFFHGCRWGWLGFPSHVEVSIFGILPNSLANPQTIAGSQWKIRLCRENRYQFQILGCLLYLLFECCLHIYIYISYLFLSVIAGQCSIMTLSSSGPSILTPNLSSLAWILLTHQLWSGERRKDTNVIRTFLGLAKRMGRYEVWICLDFVFLAI